LAEGVKEFLGASNIVTGYGRKQIINDVSLNVLSGEIVALIGHNGAGKSTLLKAIFGLLPLWRGQLIFDGKSLPAPKPRELLRLGVTYVPQGNRVFRELTVLENLKMGGTTLGNGASLAGAIEHALEFFPYFKQHLYKKAGTLSGGEKQMLAFANVLTLSPRLLLLDEPSLGLAPSTVSQTLRYIKRISDELGASVLIVEQKVREVLNIAHRVYVLRNGVVSFSGPAEALDDDAKLRELYL
jgi:ABC-type branched-subunit amino acid transport system ATPase component